MVVISSLLLYSTNFHLKLKGHVIFTIGQGGGDLFISLHLLHAAPSFDCRLGFLGQLFYSYLGVKPLFLVGIRICVSLCELITKNNYNRIIISIVMLFESYKKILMFTWKTYYLLYRIIKVQNLFYEYKVHKTLLNRLQ